MSRSIPAALLTVLNQPTMVLAKCAKMTRADGKIFGFTSFSQDITFGGVLYEAANSLVASSLRTTHGQAVDNLELTGLLTSDRITDVDILAGLYDNATIELFLVNPLESPLVSKATLVNGQIGEITVATGYYQAEFRSQGQRIDQSVAEVTTPTCRVRQLFDARCSPPGNTTPTNTPSNFQFTVPVVSVTDSLNITFGPMTGHGLDVGYFNYGRVLFQTGLNANIQKEVKSSGTVGSNATVLLQEPFPFTVSIGDSALLEAGCDRTTSTCANIFSNMINFRGEPYLPGNDRVLRWGRRQ